MTVATGAMPVLSMFRPALSTPTAHRFLVRALAAVLTTGQRTVRARAPGPVASSPRGFSQRRWSAWALARVLITCLLGHLVPSGPVFLAGDETVTEHPGPHVCGQGRHRAGAISGSWCRCSSRGRSRPDPGRFRSWRPCPVPQHGSVCTEGVIRRRLTWPGCCWRA